MFIVYYDQVQIMRYVYYDQVDHELLNSDLFRTAEDLISKSFFSHFVDTIATRYLYFGLLQNWELFANKKMNKKYPNCSFHPKVLDLHYLFCILTKLMKFYCHLFYIRKQKVLNLYYKIFVFIGNILSYSILILFSSQFQNFLNFFTELTNLKFRNKEFSRRYSHLL